MEFPDFGRIKPRDGSTEIYKDYVYWPGWLNIIPTEESKKTCLRLVRPNPDNPGERLPLGLHPGAALRIPCEGGYQVREVRRVVGSIVELDPPLTTYAIDGHQIRHIKAYSQSYVDMVVRDLIEKGKLRVGNGRFIEV